MAFVNMFHKFWEHSITSWREYYLAYSIAILASILWIVIIMSLGTDRILLEGLMTLGLMFPLSLWAPLRHTVSGRRKLSTSVLAMLAIVLVGGAVGYGIHYYDLTSFDAPQSYTIILALSYFMAILVPFAGLSTIAPRENLRTRDYRKGMFFSFVIALVSGLILWGGLAASLGSIEYLFDLTINYRRYQVLGVVSVVIFGVSIFLNKLQHIHKDHDYDGFLRFFGLYVFFPLSVIYLVILLSYGIKILISGVRPKGLIVSMVIGYVLRGLVSYILTYPLTTNNPRKKRLQQGYRVSNLLVVILLFGAIYIRIAEYGITEARYVVVMIGLWIVLSAVYNLWKSDNNLMMMILLAIGLAFISAYSPWNVSRVAFDAQGTRFEAILSAQGLRDGEQLSMIDGTIDELSNEERKDYRALIDQAHYLTQYFGTGVFDNYYDTLSGTGHEAQQEYRNGGVEFLQTLGLQGDFNEILYDHSDTMSRHFSIYTEWNHTEDLTEGGYSKLYLVSNHFIADGPESNNAISLSGPDNTTITVQKNPEEELVINLQDYASDITSYAKQQHGASTALILDHDEYRIVVNNLDGEYKNDGIRINGYTIIILTKD